VSDSEPRQILFAPDGASVLIVGRPALLLDAMDGSMLRAFGDHTLDCERAAFSPDARRICLGETLFEVRGQVSRQVRQGARIVDMASGESRDIAIDTHGRDSPLRSIAFSPAGDVIVAVESSTGVPWLIDAGTAEPIRALGSMDDGRTGAAVFSPDGECVLSVAKQLSVRECATGALKAQLHCGDARDIIFAPDAATFLLLGAHTALVCEWPTCGVLAELADGVEQFPARVAFIDGGRRVVLIDAAGAAGVYPASAEAVLTLARRLLP
jgi:WD40 repeat protein